MLPAVRTRTAGSRSRRAAETEIAKIAAIARERASLNPWPSPCRAGAGLSGPSEGLANLMAVCQQSLVSTTPKAAGSAVVLCILYVLRDPVDASAVRVAKNEAKKKH